MTGCPNTESKTTEIHVTKMASIKEESEDIKIEDAIGVKQEDTEEQTGWFLFSKLNALI